MPSRYRVTLITALSLCTAACGPFPLQVYVPDVATGEVLYSSCTFNKHVPVGVRLEANGVAAIVSLKERDGRDFIEVRFDVPEGKTLALQGSQVQLETADPKTLAHARFSAVSLVDTPIVNLDSAVPAVRMQQVAITTPLVGQRVSIGSLASSRHFWLATYVDTASAKDLWITLPGFTVNDVPSSLPLLHFQRQRVVAIALFNC